MTCSDIVDEMLARYGYPPDDYERAEPKDWLDLTDAELKAESSAARSKKLKGIRAQRWPLTERQRWCLAKWLADRANRG